MSFSTLRPLCCALRNSVRSRALACSTLGMPSFRITVLTLAAMLASPRHHLRGTPYHLSLVQRGFAAGVCPVISLRLLQETRSWPGGQWPGANPGCPKLGTLVEFAQFLCL